MKSILRFRGFSLQVALSLQESCCAVPLAIVLSITFCIEQALLLLSCFSNSAMLMADQVLLSSLGTSGVEYLPSSFTSWTQHCGPLLPHQAIRVRSYMYNYL